MQWKKIIIAGASGYVCGKIYSQGKKHPDVVIPIIEGTIAAGVCGSLLGLGISAYRKLPSHIYAISLGTNLAITTGSFLGLRQWIMFNENHIRSLTPQPVTTNQISYLASTFSGGMTGSLLSLLSRRGLYSFLQTGFAGLLTGLTAQCLYGIFEQWRKRKAFEMIYPDPDITTSNKTEWSWRSFQRVWLEFWYRQSNATAIEQDVLLLEDMIKMEKEKLNAINKELGLPVEGKLAGNSDRHSLPTTPPTTSSQLN